MIEIKPLKKKKRLVTLNDPCEEIEKLHRNFFGLCTCTYSSVYTCIVQHGM